MTKHELKCLPQFFQPVVDGKKTVEIRFNDRDFKVGDTIVLNEFSGTYGRASGRTGLLEITHILDDRRFLQPGYVALSVSKKG